MSRTVRTAPADGFWATVDAWADGVVEASAVRAWMASRCRLVASCGPFLDVEDGAEGATRPGRPLGPKAAIGARGVALADTPEVAGALADLGLVARRVDAGRRYRWDGPALTPVVVELHTAGAEGALQAWWEDVWVAWPTIRLGRADQAGRGDVRRPSRRDRATAEVRRLLADLGMAPLGHRDDTPP